jgi:multidrug efflux pump
MISALATIIRQRRSVMTMMVVMLLLGVAAYVTVPKEANPDIDVPVFYISVTQQGIAPEDAERLLVRPLETKLRGLDGLKEISGIANEGHAGILLEFSIDFDKDKALADVRDKVDQAKAELPEEADEPQIFETNFSLVPTIIVVLSGDVPERALYTNARRLKDQIEAIPSVLEAKLSGHREEQLEVVIDTLRLESYNVSQDELIAAINRNNQLVPAGFLDAGHGRFNVKVPGLFRTAEDVFELPVKVSGDGVVTLGDLAEIRRTFKDPEAYTRFNGRPAIAIQVVKRLGTNIIENNARVREVVDQFTADWPETIKVGYTLDMSKFIFEVLGSLQSAILTAITLVMVVVVAALGLRSGLLVGLAIPTSFMIGFLLLGLMGMTVNMMVMFGLVLTVGMLVDGAIVIVEYADRKMAEGMHREDAYALAAQRMFWPIVSSTATTLAAFLPMLLWPGVSGEFMSYLPIMVIIVLSASLLTAMVFLPVVGSLVGRTTASAKDIETARNLSGDSHVDYSEIHGLTGIYLRTLNVLVRRPGQVMLGAVLLSGVIVYLFAQNAAGVEFFVDEEPDQAILTVSARGNLSAAEARDLVVQVEREVAEVAGISNIYVTTGSPSGKPEVGQGQDQPVDQIGQMIIEFDDYCCRRKGDEIFAEIRERLAPLPGIRAEVRNVEGGPPTGKDIRLEISGPDYDQVKQVTGLVRAHLDHEMGGLIDIEDGRPLPGIEWELKVDREEAGRFGTDIASIGAMVQLVTNGILIGKYRPDDSEDEVDIRVRLPEPERSISRLDQLRVRTEQGLVPIRNMVERKAQPKVSSITRQNGVYAMMVKANTAEGVLADTKVRELERWLGEQDWPVGVKFRFRGADEEQKEAGDFLGKAMAGSLFLMFIILVTQFNSFYQTVITLSTVIMSVIGVLLGMLVTGQTFSIIMTGTGVVALAGIVVNNAIVLIDTFNRMHRELGLEVIDAALRTAAQRLRPVLLTTITTMLGLVPMALQVTVNFFKPEIAVGSITSIWWVQLSTAVIFGLGFATLLTLVLVPTLLVAPTIYGQKLTRLRSRFARRLPGRAGKAEPDDKDLSAPANAGGRMADAAE